MNIARHMAVIWSINWFGLSHVCGSTKERDQTKPHIG